MKRALIALLFLAVHIACAGAAPLVVSEDQSSIAIGARMMSLGGMLGSLSSPNEAVTTNPAELAHVTGFQFSSMYTNLLGDVSTSLGHFALPTRLGPLDGALGFGYMSSDVNSIFIPTQTGFSSLDYSQKIFWLGFGTPLISRPQFSVDVGSSLKYYTKAFSGYLNAAAGGLNADVAIQFSKPGGVKVSAVFKNVIPARFGGKIVWAHGTEETLRPDVRLGLTLPLRNRVLLGGELQLPSISFPVRTHLGVEWKMVPMLMARLGIDQTVNVASPGGVYGNLTAGLGMDFKGVHVDYAFHPYGTASSAVTHYISVGWVPFKAEIKAPPQITSLPTTTPIVPKEETSDEEFTSAEELESMEENFLDIREDYWAAHSILSLKTLGILGGYSDKTFRPSKFVTLTDVKRTLHKIVKGPFRITLSSKGTHRLSLREAIWVIVEATGSLTPQYFDATVSGIEPTDPATPYLAYAEREGLLNHLNGRSIVWKRLMTRAEFAEVVSKLPIVQQRIQGSRAEKNKSTRSNIEFQ